MGIFTKGINKGAYRGRLICPYTYYVWDDVTHTGEMVDCKSAAIRLMEEITPTRLRYRCRKCGGKFQYDISNSTDNPYAAYSPRSKFGRDLKKLLGGRTLKGGV